MKIVSIVGTRPNFMKIAPLVRELKKHKIEHILVHTGQHYDDEMSKLFFDDLELPKPDEHLVAGTNEEFKDPKSFLKVTITEALKRHNPDLVIVVGDVNSTVAGAKAAHDLGIKVAHVEAGLRSFDKDMPEEINRTETDKISDFLFTTEKSGNDNLLKEGISKDKVFFVGNVMIDTLLNHKEKAENSKILKKLGLEKNNYSVLTLHRPSNVDTKVGFENIISILDGVQSKIKIVFPVHPRTRKNIQSFDLNNKMKSMKNLILTGPLGYLDFLHLMSNSKLMLTDSGGIQEETTVLGIPCITLRKNTERPVTVEQGTNLLVSTDKDKVIEKSIEIIDNKINIKNRIPKLWDGKAAGRIVNILLERFKNKTY
jgi:UDP-N-acetylglucosamine 2-epimerase (non-hydrolysing)|tara:strand:- start:415 stop:1524 length:1110 start_codon:yes stop_codon:yes gene_type:complete